MIAPDATASQAAASEPSEPRAVVSAFASLMEAKLRANDHKGDWCLRSVGHLLERLTQEYLELVTALGSEIATPSDVASECADVALFALMLCDRVGALPGMSERDGRGR